MFKIDYRALSGLCVYVLSYGLGRPPERLSGWMSQPSELFDPFGVKGSLHTKGVK